jgi:sporulation protein YlmC with PRC-barrel domain
MGTTQLAAALAIALGGEVTCRDGYIGHVRRLVVEPESRRVTGVVVEHGLLRHRVVVPMAHVARTEDTVMCLDIDRRQLGALPPYMAVDIARPDPAWTARHGAVPDDAAADRRAYVPWGVPPLTESIHVMVRRHLHTGVPEPQIPLGQDARVVCPTGLVGHLDQVELDPASHAIRALVVRAGYIRAREVQVPAGRITAIIDGEIRIGAC